jgi:protoporphyrin/coproporphyrin ferrochelatase
MSSSAVILMNLGSPDSTQVKDVRKYLHEFLMDKRVIDYPYVFRKILVDGIIAPLRAPKSAEAYKMVWLPEGSPLIVLTKKLQSALQAELSCPVDIAMRYGHPSMKSAYDRLAAENPDLAEVILIPLYPHYAMSSYETAVEYAKEIHAKYKYPFKIRILSPFYNEPAYIGALADSIRPYLETEYDHILFSYHGLPARHIRKADITGHHCLQSEDCCWVHSDAHRFCYRHQVFVTTRQTALALGIPPDKYSVSFQSRLGREEWIQPYTVAELAAFPSRGVKRLLVVCPAFVSDCLETLEEIAMEGKQTFMAAGGESFTAIPCMNIQPRWVKVLAGWIGAMQPQDPKWTNTL